MDDSARFERDVELSVCFMCRVYSHNLSMLLDITKSYALKVTEVVSISKGIKRYNFKTLLEEITTYALLILSQSSTTSSTIPAIYHKTNIRAISTSYQKGTLAVYFPGGISTNYGGLFFHCHFKASMCNMVLNNVRQLCVFIQRLEGIFDLT